MQRHDAKSPQHRFTFEQLSQHAGLRGLAERIAQKDAQTATSRRVTSSPRKRTKSVSLETRIRMLFVLTIRELQEAGDIVEADAETTPDPDSAGESCFLWTTFDLLDAEIKKRGRAAVANCGVWEHAVAKLDRMR